MKKSTMSRMVAFETMSDEHADEEGFKKLTVSEFLFDGYFVSFMKTISDISGEELLPDNTFGLYYKVHILAYMFDLMNK